MRGVGIYTIGAGFTRRGAMCILGFFEKIGRMLIVLGGELLNRASREEGIVTDELKYFTGHNSSVFLVLYV